MDLSREVWMRAGKVIDELRDSYIGKTAPEVNLFSSQVIITLKEYDVRHEDLKDLTREIPSLKEKDSYDVSDNNREGLRIIIREEEI